MNRLVFALVLLAPFFMASTVGAQRSQDKFQLGLGMPLFAYVDTTLENDDSGLELDQTVVSWGVYNAPLLELGYGAGAGLVVGGLVQFGGESYSVDGSDESLSVMRLFLAPKFDYMFSAGEPLRPFLGVAAGVVHSSASIEDGVEGSSTGFAVMGRAGLRYFAAEGLSIDPHLAIMYSTASSDEAVAQGIALATDDISVSALSVIAYLTISGWL